MKENSKLKHIVFDVILVVILIIIDRITKNIAQIKLMNNEPYPIINNVFVLQYLENRGAAFGMLQNKKIIFIVVTCIFIALVCYCLYKLPTIKKYNIFEIVLCFLMAGAIGNMIDRIFLNYVIDFFYFVLIDFPIFNVADIYVTCGCVAFAIITIFVFKEDEFEFLSFKQKKE